VLDAVAADELDTVAVLVGQHSPAVHLLLVDPPGAVAGLADERGCIGAKDRSTTISIS
jgi:hypothetical protein